MLCYQSKVVQFKVGGDLLLQNVWFSNPVSFRVKIILCQNLHLSLIFRSVVAFKISDFTIFPPLLSRDSIGAGRREMLPNVGKILFPSEKSKNAILFILKGGRQPPWPSWQGALSGWGPRTSWKCSWWKPSPCKADRCRYSRERLKVGKYNFNES